ncbi:MAG: diguanylate cyclase [Deltaproteobacteria bacterium]|nr:diguanylate cyclase [Deltaproteobacteria bacterium]
MATSPSLWDFVRSLVFFRRPIRQKFWIFCTSIAFWYLLIGALGAYAARDPVYRNVVVVATLLAIPPLVLFTFLITRSLIRPLGELTRCIKGLAEGEIDLRTPIAVRSLDEVGTLSEQVNRLLRSLLEIGTFKKVIEEDDTVDDVYLRLGHEFVLHGLDVYNIYDVDGNKNRIRCALTSGGDMESACKEEIFVNANLCRAKKTGETIASAEFPGVCRHFNLEGVQHVCVPMIIGGATGGVAQFVFRGEDRDGSGTKVGHVRRFIQETFPVIEAKRLTETLRESSLRDVLTGLHNRRFLEEYTDILIATSERHGSTIGLLMGDLDFFKQVNDTFGHDAGDAVLRETAAVIARSVRASDLVIRFGGEEFLVVMPDCKNAAMEIAERIRVAVGENKVKTARGVVRKEISFGVAEYPTDATNFWQAIKFADVALYNAKETGRNKVVRFTKEMWKDEQY